jgi:hypothetical protein
MSSTPIKKLKGHQKQIDKKMLQKVIAGKARGDKFEPTKIAGNMIIDGHHRVTADRAMGKKTTQTKAASRNDMLKALKKQAKVKSGKGNVGKENG